MRHRFTEIREVWITVRGATSRYTCSCLEVNDLAESKVRVLLIDMFAGDHGVIDPKIIGTIYPPVSAGEIKVFDRTPFIDITIGAGDDLINVSMVPHDGQFVRQDAYMEIESTLSDVGLKTLADLRLSQALLGHFERQIDIEEDRGNSAMADQIVGWVDHLANRVDKLQRILSKEDRRGLPNNQGESECG